MIRSSLSSNDIKIIHECECRHKVIFRAFKCPKCGKPLPPEAHPIKKEGK